MRFYAFHGVMPQERKVGGEFLVSVKVGYPLEQAMRSDDVANTLNYAELYELVKKEMMQPSNLLEHVIRLVSSLSLKDESINTWKVGVERALKKYIPGGHDDNESEE